MQYCMHYFQKRSEEEEGKQQKNQSRKPRAEAKSASRREFRNHSANYHHCKLRSRALYL